MAALTAPGTAKPQRAYNPFGENRQGSSNSMREGDEKRRVIRILIVTAIWALAWILGYCAYIAPALHNRTGARSRPALHRGIMIARYRAELPVTILNAALALPLPKETAALALGRLRAGS